MTSRVFLLRTLGAAIAIGATSCSLVIDRDSHQCESDLDCISFPGTGCDTNKHVCRLYAISIDSGTRNPDAIDAGSDVGGSCEGDGGCYACTPTTERQFSNACTDSPCRPFDNGARLKRSASDGGLVPLPADAGGGAGPGSSDAGIPKVVEHLGAHAGTTSRGTPAEAECGTMQSPLYVVGSTAVKPYLAAIARALRAQTPEVTILYAEQGSCVGVSAILSGTPAAGPFVYWDQAGTEQSCTVAAPVNAHIGVSDVFATSCLRLPGGLPSNVEDFLGPVQSMTFVVPKGSTQTSISAEAAYYVYGFGAASGVDPWVDESRIFQRDSQSGTQRMVAAAIGVEGTIWRGTRTTGSGDLRAKVSAALPSEAALGILSSEVAQENRQTLRVLAYQHYGQNCGYYPDKEETSNEKQNVRDGHYAIWGPLHLFTQMGSNGYPANAQAADVIGFMTGTRPAPSGIDLVTLEAQHHVIPQCAMRVSRSEEIGAMSSFAPAQSCSCFYDKVANGSTDCMPCSNKTDCPAATPFCNYGYCEIR
jgi:ABC-type phosphate transport system substrate-binding protein